MRIQYATNEVEKICTVEKYGVRFLGGNRQLFDKLRMRLNQISVAEDIDYLREIKSIRLHRLRNKGNRNLEGYYSMDVKSIREPWRIIIEFLDEDGRPFVPADIDLVAERIRIVEIEEVSRHYE